MSKGAAIHLSPRAIEELLAKAIYADRNGKGCKPWSQRDARHKEPYLLDAKAILPALEAEGMVVVTKSALDWLFGEAPDADGKWFGECEESTKLIAGRFKRTYWWRSKFRAMIAAAQGGDDAGQ